MSVPRLECLHWPQLACISGISSSRASAYSPMGTSLRVTLPLFSSLTAILSARACIFSVSSPSCSVFKHAWSWGLWPHRTHTSIWGGFHSFFVFVLFFLAVMAFMDSDCFIFSCKTCEPTFRVLALVPGQRSRRSRGERRHPSLSPHLCTRSVCSKSQLLLISWAFGPGGAVSWAKCRCPWSGWGSPLYSSVY